jgi:hypothetical protein
MVRDTSSLSCLALENTIVTAIIYQIVSISLCIVTLRNASEGSDAYILQHPTISPPSCFVWLTRRVQRDCRIFKGRNDGLPNGRSATALRAPCNGYGCPLSRRDLAAAADSVNRVILHSSLLLLNDAAWKQRRIWSAGGMSHIRRRLSCPRNRGESSFVGRRCKCCA